MDHSKTASSVSRVWSTRSRLEKTLFILFILSLPFIQPSIRSDGRGYYAYLRSPLIDHNFQFAGDWLSPPIETLRDCPVCPEAAKQYWNNPANQLLVLALDRKIYANPITKTGHLPNFYSVGPAILWSLFVAVAHLAVLAADRLGASISPDGRS